MNETQPSFYQNSTANSSSLMNERTRSREMTSELDCFLAGIDEFKK